MPLFFEKAFAFEKIKSETRNTIPTTAISPIFVSLLIFIFSYLVLTEAYSFTVSLQKIILRKYQSLLSHSRKVALKIKGIIRRIAG